MKRVLLVSYLFPPAGGIGVQRALSLAKYLPQHDVEVHVLRAPNASGPVRDPELMRQVPPSVAVHDAFTPELPFALRQRLWRWFSPNGRKNGTPPASTSPAGRKQHGWKQQMLNLSRRLLAPEPEILWAPFALRQARRIVRQRRIEAVIVTAPPFSAFVIGNRLKAEFPALRLISDFRDDWLRFYLGTFAYQQNEHVRRRAVEIERQTVDRSDAVVVVTATMLDQIRERYPDLPPDRFVYIPNGYDPEIFRNWRPAPAANGRVVISHVGTVYSASSARYYLNALDSMPEEIRNGIETRFVGRVADDEVHFMHGRRSAVRLLGFVPQQQALDEMGRADYLLVTMTDGPSLTGKIFEYLATGKPILAITPDNGEVARLLRETGCGWSAAPDDTAGICRMLSAAYERARSRTTRFEPNWDAIRRFERSRLALEFRALLK